MSKLRLIKAKSTKPPYGWKTWDVSRTTLIDSYAENTSCMFTGMRDVNKEMIWENDIVEFLGKRGTIVYCNGAFGIEFTDYIVWKDIEEEINELTGNNPHFVYNDNFISLWEIYWNFNDEYNHLRKVKVIRNEHDFEKIPVSEIEIIVAGTKEKPLYHIKYFDLRDGKYHIGFSSYCLDYVYAWKDECFRLVERFAENEE